MISAAQVKQDVEHGDFRLLARALTIVENNLEGAAELMSSLTFAGTTPVIGITGPPGAGKSTLVNGIIKELEKNDKRVAILAIDPTSPFNHGSLLGDRIRMSSHFNSDRVYIRSLASRGSVGGLSAKTIELTEVLKSAGFDYVLVETVGVGQSELEIAGLADMTIVVLVPEGGDEIQQIKSGLMEIASLFVVNKADREGADTFANKLKKILHQQTEAAEVLLTVAEKDKGVPELVQKITSWKGKPALKTHLLGEKAWKLIAEERMKAYDRKQLQDDLELAMNKPDFNLYTFAKNYSK